MLRSVPRVGGICRGGSALPSLVLFDAPCIPARAWHSLPAPPVPRGCGNTAAVQSPPAVSPHCSRELGFASGSHQGFKGTPKSCPCSGQCHHGVPWGTQGGGRIPLPRKVRRLTPSPGCHHSPDLVSLRLLHVFNTHQPDGCEPGAEGGRRLSPTGVTVFLVGAAQPRRGWCLGEDTSPQPRQGLIDISHMRLT